MIYKKHLFCVMLSVIVLFLLSTGCNSKESQIKEAYLKYREAVKSENLEEIKKYISSSKIKDFEGAKGKQKLTDLRKVKPYEMEVIQLEIKNEKTAVVTFLGWIGPKDGKIVREQGTVRPRNALRGNALVVLEGGLWKIESEGWISNY
ncbi:MAG: hypothetical protein ABIH42_10005 [Planctomycetota bacterium]